MSRVIKFRAWDIDNKEFVYISESVDGEIWINNGLSTVEMPAHKEPYEQYTGLKDKNGDKEIYEGDIVEQLMYVSEGKEHITTWAVRWNKTECCFELHYLSGSLFGDSMMADDEEYKVIGNIHENPDLLESK